MNSYARLAWLTGATLVVLLIVFACLRMAADKARRTRSMSDADANPTALINAPANTLPPEEIFRRAFWRQPSSTDIILNAERRETRAGANETVDRWQWFLSIRPSPELLGTLRDANNFGLMPVKPGAPIRHWPEEPQPAPAWFPAVDKAFDFEVLQSSQTGLTVLYSAKKNLLFATDSGGGFAAPVR